jgi:hypothetical protein
MFRLLGFLIGSLTSIFIILLIIGMPTLHLDDRQENQQRYDAAIEKLRAKQQEIDVVTGQLTEDVARVAETVGNGIDAVTGTESADPADAPVEPVATDAGATLPETGLPPAPVEPSWYSFWNPFRSEIAANGFVSQLERVTGIDYRVVRVKSGVYEVAFAYYDDSERSTKLSRISAATGLELPDS